MGKFSNEKMLALQLVESLGALSDFGSSRRVVVESAAVLSNIEPSAASLAVSGSAGFSGSGVSFYGGVRSWMNWSALEETAGCRPLQEFLSTALSQ